MTGWIWTVIWLGSALLGAGITVLLDQQGLSVISPIAYVLFSFFNIGWLVYGFAHWWHLRPVKRVAVVFGSTWIAGLLSWFALRSGWTPLAIVIIGAWAMSVGFFVGLQLIRLLLSFGHPVLGVGRTLVDEAIRMRVPLVFIVLLVILVPVAPFVLDEQDQLRYRIQTFVTWSMVGVSGLLSLMTVFLAVGTITSEIQQRQIFLSMSKSVSRLHYLAGKWLGIVLLNFLLVAVCGTAIYAFTMLLSLQPAKNAEDRLAVDERVLVARVAQAPRPVNMDDFRVSCQKHLEVLRRENPARYGRQGELFEQTSGAIQREIAKAVRARWYTVGPRTTEVYRFSGLGAAKEYGDQVQLRIKPKVSGPTVDSKGLVYLNMIVNGRPYQNPENSSLGVPPIVDDTYHVMPIASELIDAQGELTITILNPVIDESSEQPSISFNIKDGIEVFYRVGSFEGNLVRSLLILWVRLAFLAMLGLAAGTFLGFPVACLCCLIIYLAAASSGFLAESLEYYSTLPRGGPWERIAGTVGLIWEKITAGDVWSAFKVLIRLIGTAFMLLVPNFGAYNPTPLLADGRLVSSQMLGWALAQIGVLWTGAVGVIGYLIFRSRELARVIV